MYYRTDGTAIRDNELWTFEKSYEYLFNLHAMQFCQPEEYQGCFSYTVWWKRFQKSILEKREGNFEYLCHTLTIIGHIGQAVNKQKEILQQLIIRAATLIPASRLQETCATNPIWTLLLCSFKMPRHSNIQKNYQPCNLKYVNFLPANIGFCPFYFSFMRSIIM